MMKDDLVKIAAAAGYTKTSRLLAASAGDEFHLINYLLKNSLRGNHAILFLPCKMYQVTPFDLKYASAYSRSSCEHYLLMHPDLKDEYFRKIFTSFELILYKTCHIWFENLSYTYRFESEKTRRRFARLEGAVSVPSWSVFANLFEEIFRVRDGFSHSFVDLKDLKYKNVSLDDCFGGTWLGASHNEVDFTFTEDLSILYDPILKTFITRQFEQIDQNKFCHLCDDVIGIKTLGPTSI